jgi:hypothetical protein
VGPPPQDTIDSYHYLYSVPGIEYSWWWNNSSPTRRSTILPPPTTDRPTSVHLGLACQCRTTSRLTSCLHSSGNPLCCSTLPALSQHRRRATSNSTGPEPLKPRAYTSSTSDAACRHVPASPTACFQSSPCLLLLTHHRPLAVRVKNVLFLLTTVDIHPSNRLSDPLPPAR